MQGSSKRFSALYAKRDQLQRNLREVTGVKSVGVTKRNGTIALLVLVDHKPIDLKLDRLGDVFVYEDVPVVVEIVANGELFQSNVRGTL